MNPSLVELVFVGGVIFLALVFLSFINSLMQGWANRRGAVNSPMSITLFTQQSPADVNRDARAAGCSRALFLLAIALIAWLTLLYFRPSLAWGLTEFVVTVLRQVLLALGDLIALILNSIGD